jgi:hypothetical protein
MTGEGRFRHPGDIRPVRMEAQDHPPGLQRLALLDEAG